MAEKGLKHFHLTQAEREKIAELLKYPDLTTIAIARRFSCSPTTVRAINKELGVRAPRKPVSKE